MTLKWAENNSLLPSSLGQAKQHYLMGDAEGGPRFGPRSALGLSSSRQRCPMEFTGEFAAFHGLRVYFVNSNFNCPKQRAGGGWCSLALLCLFSRCW